MAWEEHEEPTVDEVTEQLWQYKESLSSFLHTCISAVEKLSEKFYQLKENLFSSPPVQSSLHQLKENTLEKFSEEVHQFKESLFSSPPVQTSVSYQG